MRRKRGLRRCIANERTDVTRQNGSDILGIDVWFRRIFRKGIVLSNVSAIAVSLNGAGEITSLRVKWPKFERINIANVPVQWDVAKSMALDIITDTTAAAKGLNRVHKTNGTIVGLARGWKKVDAIGRIQLSPCLAFETDFLMENGEHAIQFLEVPMLQRYYPSAK
jgi:hypothetical protein